MKIIEHELKSIKHKITKGLHNESNRNGFLTCEEVEYLDCFRINNRQLSFLFKKDTTKWSNKLEKLKLHQQKFED